MSSRFRRRSSGGSPQQRISVHRQQRGGQRTDQPALSFGQRATPRLVAAQRHGSDGEPHRVTGGAVRRAEVGDVALLGRPEEGQFLRGLGQPGEAGQRPQGGPRIGEQFLVAHPHDRDAEATKELERGVVRVPQQRRAAGGVAASSARRSRSPGG